MKKYKLKKFLKENIGIICFFIIGLFFIYLPIPYYIEAPGGLINANERVEVNSKNAIKGSFHMAYVSSMKASIPTILFAKLHHDWDIQKQEEMVADGETEQEAEYRSRISLQEGNQRAILLAYQAANKYIEIIQKELYITYRFPEADTSLEVGDKIEKVMNQPIQSLEDFSKIIQKYPKGTKLKITVKNKKKEKQRYATIIMEGDRKIIGVMTSTIYQFKMKPGIKIKTDQNESGASGGLIMTLSIYNALTKEDITHGDKIAGTGTIEMDGSVGSISGVKYKLLGAVKNKAKIFLVPSGDNYKEALKIKKERKLNIEIVSIKTFEQALKYLKNRD